MKITFLLTRRVPDVPSPVLMEVARLLRGYGHDVDGWIPEDRLLPTATDDLSSSSASSRPDELYLLKSHTELALSFAGALRLRGARLLNRYEACVLAQDKVTASHILRAAKIPTPDTWLVNDVSLAEPLMSQGPLILKPNRGHRGAHVFAASTMRELAAVSMPHGPTIAQRLVEGPGEDLKVYVAGDEVFAVRKPFDENSFSRPGRPVPVTSRVREIAQKTRVAFGLELFGIDIIESPDGPMVVDVNYFPGYKGCEDPEPAIADVIATYVRECR